MMFKSKLFALVTIGGAVAAAASFAPAAQALSFDFAFDSTPDATVTDPLIGTGTFSFDGDPGVGDFALTSLTNFEFDFDIEGSTFSNTDITTPLANVLVRISESGGITSLNFGGALGGLFGGSIDFVNSSGSQLSFQPGFGSLYFYNEGSGNVFGTYEATLGAAPTEVPTPAALLPVLSGMGAAALRKRKQESVAS